MTENVANYELERKRAAGKARLEAMKKAQGLTEGNVPVLSEEAARLRQNVPTPNRQEPAPFNWNRLTDIEKSIYTDGLASVLPQGLRPSGEWLLEKLDRFNNSWVGKVLPVFDVFAEGVERSFGMIAQYKDAKERGELEDFSSHLGKAWQASQFYYNVANIIMPQDKDGNVITVYSDMPGYQELYNIRKKLIAGKTSVEAEAELYDELGALRVRAVLQDALGHIVMDPGNIIFPKVFKTIGPSAFKAKRGELLYKMGYYSNETIDAFRVTAETAYEAARSAGRGAQNAGELYNTAARAIEELAEAEGKAFTRAQKFVISVTGGMPTTAEKAIELVQNSPKGLQKILPWNWFRLTRESMAAEVMQNLSIQSQNLVGHIDDPMEGIAIMRRAVRSLDTPQLGHIVSTPQGRAAMSWLKGAEPLLDELEGMIRAATESGDLPQLRAIAGLTGDDIKEVVRLIQNGEEEGLLAKLSGALDAAPVAGKEAAHQFLTDLRNAGTLNAESLKQLGAVLLDLPFDPDTFRLHLLQGLWDYSAKMAINKFGIEAAGFWNKAANTLKAAESLIFLRWNPAYAVNNLLNNEITGVARGVYNLMSPTDVIKYWERVGVMHPSLMQGIGMGGLGVGKTLDITADAENAFAKLLDAYGDAVGQIHSAKQMGTGWVGKLGNKIKNFNSPFDASKFAQQVERSASMRFMTQGMIEGMKHYWKPGFGYDLVGDFAPKLAEELGDEIVSNLQKFIQDNPHNFAAKVTGAALNRTTQRAVEMAVEKLGIPLDRIDDVFGADFTARIGDALGDAMQSGNAQAIRESMSIVRSNVRNHIDDWFVNADPTELLMDGPNGLARVWGEQSWHEFDMWNAHLDATEKNARFIRGLPPEARGPYWERHFANANASWDNYFGWWKKRNQSMLDAIEQRGFNVQFSDGRSLQTVMGEAVDARTAATKTFHTNKNRILKSAVKSDSPDAWRKAQDLLDTEYQTLIREEIGSWKALDDAIEPLVPEQLRDIYRFQREQIRNARHAYMNWNRGFYWDANKLPGEMRAAKFATEYNEARQIFIEGIYNQDMTFRMAMAGDEKAMAAIRRAMQEATSEVVEEGAEAVAKGAEGVAQAAPEAGLQLAPDQQLELPFVPEQRKIMPDQPPQGVAADVTFYGEGSAILDAVEQSALDIIKERRVTLANLAPEVETQVLKYLDSVGEQAKGARTAAMYHAQARRDSALLNYSRRTEFDNAIGTAFPYAFWATHSIYNWALYSLERPFVLANYMRTRKMFELAGGNKEIPQRLRGFGQLKVKLPFWEDWMGDGVFVNPLRIGLPIETFMYPYERYTQAQQSKETQAARILEQMVTNEEITPEEYQQALRDKSGPIWRQAYDQSNKGEDTAFEFASMLFSPHAPLMWAYRAATQPGEPVQPGPLMPMTRNIKAITGYLGVGDGGINIEGGIRKALGLPEFDEYDDYRIDRMLTNMASTNEIPTSVAIRAMIDRSGPEFEEAKRRAAKEYGVRGTASIVGIPANIYPPGEQKSIELYRKFGEAVEAYQNGDIDAYGEFFDKYPEAKARLALFDGPEERAKNFLKDELWSAYNEMPSLHRKQVREALGPEFQTSFLAEQNYEAIDPMIMGVWLRMMGGDPPGTMSGNALPIALAPKEDAQLLQVFYDTRTRKWGDELWDDMDKAFSMVDWDAAMAAYPNVRAYLAYRKDFMYRNPQVAPYLEEDPDKLPKYATQAQAEQAFGGGPNLTDEELYTLLGPILFRLYKDDEPLPDAAKEAIESLGLQVEE